MSSKMSKDFSLLAGGREDYNDFIQWLQDHNWCKVTNCCFCHKWKPKRPIDTRGRCERTGEEKYYDDYCSEAVERIDKK